MFYSVFIDKPSSEKKRLHQRALESPAELEVVFCIVLKLLEFLNELELTHEHHSRDEFKRYVFVSVGSAVAAGL